MKPYYDEKGITIYHADCLPAMKEMPDNEFSLAIVDPPYGIGRDHYSCGKKPSEKWKNPTQKIYSGEWDTKPSPVYFKELERVSKNRIIWGGNYFVLDPSPCWIVWDKKNAGLTMADCELAWTSFNTAIRKFEWMWSGFYKQKPEHRIHPTQKPVALYKWLLTNYAKQGQTILDTHLGSGSIAIACDVFGFDLTAFEIDGEYIEGATDRLKRHRTQGVLPL